ncbi:MAG: glycosyltransferase, partial [Phycisphaerae bacterium]|nr:glycosyltransferase [Phycisphaerae bacterium]
MKIALVSMSFGRHGLGASVRAIGLAKYFQRLGHQVLVVTASAPEDAPAELRASVRLSVPFRPLMARPMLLARAVNRVLVLPEPQRTWCRDVRRPLTELLRREVVDVLLVTSPPHTTQLIGIECARSLDIPYFADLRDDWLTNHRYCWHTPLHKLIATRVERAMVRAAAGVFLNTPIVRERFAGRYPRFAAKLHTFTNGYDEDDFQGGADGSLHGSDPRRILVYAGGGYGTFAAERLAVLVEQIRTAGL